MAVLDPYGQRLPRQQSYHNELAIPTAGTPLAQQAQNVPVPPAAPPAAAPQAPAPVPAPIPAAAPAPQPTSYGSWQGPQGGETYTYYYTPSRSWNWGAGGNGFLEALLARLGGETDDERERRLGGVFFTPKSLSALSGGSASFTGTPGSTGGGTSGSSGGGWGGGFLAGLLARLGGL